jgi:alkyl hydroperoxide reductase subunit AhpC
MTSTIQQGGELSRLIAAKQKVAAPVNCKPGDEVISVTSVSDEDAKAAYL